MCRWRLFCFSLLLLSAAVCQAEELLRCVDLDALSEDDRQAVLNEMVYPRFVSLFNQHTRYPKEAYDNCVEGRVKLEFVIGKKGKISQVEIIERSQSGVLDRAALEQAREIISIVEKNPLVKQGYCLTDELVVNFYVEYDIPYSPLLECHSEDEWIPWRAGPLRSNEDLKELGIGIE